MQLFAYDVQRRDVLATASEYLGLYLLQSNMRALRRRRYYHLVGLACCALISILGQQI